MAQVVTFEKRVPEHDVWTSSGRIHSHLETEDIEQLEEQAALSVADPSSLGLWALATGTWIFGVVSAGWLSPAAFTTTGPVLFMFAGIVQFIAGLFAFRRANALMATLLCAIGAFYGTTGFAIILHAMGPLPVTGSAAKIAGDFLESFAFISAALAFAALGMNRAVAATMGLLAIGFCLVGIPLLAGITTGAWAIVATVGGAFLCASAACAYYAGMASVVNSSWRRSVMPVGRSG